MLNNIRSPKSSNIKAALLVAAFCIVVPILFYTHNLVNRLQDKEREVANLYAKSIEYIVNSPASGGDYSFIFDQVIRSIDFPIILTDKTGKEIATVKNISLDTTLTKEQQEHFISAILAEMDASNKPIVVAYQDTIILQKVHYGESPLIQQLRWLPYIEITIGGLFILIGYIGFSYIKRSEQSNIWVGMARETAHQLGTPLSSLMGWIELLKLQSASNLQLYQHIEEMEHDVQRLNRVAHRFSKIGSQPDLRDENIRDVIEKVIGYFEKRIPQMGKKVAISITAPDSITAKINCELFEWVIENLIKNSLDAMDDGRGAITFVLSATNKNIFIDVTDTGKGIDQSVRKDIFRPGFSTKKRGWGLGLSLSKRIIETYHRGKLIIKESKMGVGTTFRISLKA